MKTDPLNEVRNIRRTISEECDNDPKKVFEYYVSHQKESKRSGKYRFISTPYQSVNSVQDTEQSDSGERRSHDF